MGDPKHHTAVIALTGLLICCCAMAFTIFSGDENSPPLVRITSPVNRSLFRWNSDLPYSISVLDKEDGNSDYDEIADHEVVLFVMYLPDSLQASNYQTGKVKEEEPRALTLMKTSTCFNCHTSRNKLIGPSFDRIAERYPYHEKTVAALSSKVMHGSIGSWGEVPMPSNPDLKPDEINEMVRWILKNNTDPNAFYQVGLKGVIRIKGKSEKDAGKGVYILTASYADHGLAGKTYLRKRGQHTIVIKP